MISTHFNLLQQAVRGESVVADLLQLAGPVLPILDTKKSDFTAKLGLGKRSNQTRYAYDVGVLPSEPYSGAFLENRFLYVLGDPCPQSWESENRPKILAGRGDMVHPRCGNLFYPPSALNARGYDHNSLICRCAPNFGEFGPRFGHFFFRSIPGSGARV